MKSFSLSDVDRIKMVTNPPKEIVDCGFRVIFKKRVKSWVGFGWIDDRDATREDYKNIPEVFKD